MLFDSIVLRSDHISCQPRRRFSRDAPPTPHGKRAAPPRPVGQMPRPCIYGFLQSSWAFLIDNCQILTEPPSPLCHLWSSFWCYGFRRAHFNLDFLGKVGCLCVALSNGKPLFLGSCAMLVQAVPPLGRAGWVGAETQLRDATHWARSHWAAFKEFKFLQKTFDSSSFRKQRGGNMATTGLARRCTQYFFLRDKSYKIE